MSDIGVSQGLLVCRLLIRLVGGWVRVLVYCPTIEIVYLLPHGSVVSADLRAVGQRRLATGS
jgi:hypothetical protein